MHFIPTKCSEFYRVNIRDEEKFLSNYLRWYLLAFVNSLFLFNKGMPLKCSVMWYFSMRYSGQQLIFVLLFTFSIIDQFILYGVPFLYLLTYLDSSVRLMCSYGRNPYCDSGTSYVPEILINGIFIWFRNLHNLYLFIMNL